MRLKITFELQRETALPLNYQYALGELVYRLLGESEPEYARFLHDEGYRLEPEKAKAFKLYTYSNLQIPKSRRQIVGDRLRIAPGPVEWLLTSPVHDFLHHSATGLLSAGNTVEIDRTPFTVREVVALPTPVFRGCMRFSCLSSIVASRPVSDSPAYYLRPSDAVAFSDAVRNNLLQKYRLLHGVLPQNDSLSLAFDEDYLARASHGGTKKTTIKGGIEVVGVQAPFTVTGSPDLIRVGYECGFGEKNSMGFGMAEIMQKGSMRPC